MLIPAQIALPQTTIDIFVIASVLLAIVGTLFLAYDLLGRENGPLRWFTLVIICGLVSGFVLGTISTLLQRILTNSIDLIWTLRFLVLGGIMGFFTVILVELHPSKTRPPIFSRTGTLIGIALGLMFALIVIYILGGPPEGALAVGVPCAVMVSIWQRITWEPSQAVSNPRGVWQFVAWEEPSTSTPPGTGQFESRKPPHPKPRVFSRKGLVLGLLLGFLMWFVFFFTTNKDLSASLLASVPLALISGVISGTWRFINWEPAHRKPHLFSRKGFWTGLVAGFVPWLLFFIVQSYAVFPNFTGPIQGFALMIDISIVLCAVVLYALANTAAGSIAQYTLWRANTLPHRTLGAIGLVLITVAFGLPGMQPVIEILNDIK